MTPSAMAGLLAAASLVAMMASGAAAQEIAVTDLVCETRSGERPRVRIDIEPSSRKTAAYRVDEDDETLVFSPETARRLPEAVVKLDFARACQRLLGREASVCAAVRLLSYQGALEKDDVTRLERYYVGLADREPQRAREAYSTIKEVFACF